MDVTDCVDQTLNQQLGVVTKLDFCWMKQSWPGISETENSQLVHLLWSFLEPGPSYLCAWPEENPVENNSLRAADIQLYAGGGKWWMQFRLSPAVLGIVLRLTCVWYAGWSDPQAGGHCQGQQPATMWRAQWLSTTRSAQWGQDAAIPLCHAHQQWPALSATGVCVCMCVWVCACMHACVYTCVCVCAMCVRVCVCVCVHVNFWLPDFVKLAYSYFIFWIYIEKFFVHILKLLKKKFIALCHQFCQKMCLDVYSTSS